MTSLHPKAHATALETNTNLEASIIKLETDLGEQKHVFAIQASAMADIFAQQKVEQKKIFDEEKVFLIQQHEVQILSSAQEKLDIRTQVTKYMEGVGFNRWRGGGGKGSIFYN